MRALLVSTINPSRLATLEICCFSNSFDVNSMTHTCMQARDDLCFSSIESMMKDKSSFLEQDAVRTSPNAERSCSTIADSDPL